MNYNIKLNLKDLPQVFVKDIAGATTTKRCVCIPIQEAHIFEGQKGIYLNLTAWERKEKGQYGDTHFVKVQVSGSDYATMSDEQRKAIPIIGSMKEAIQSQTQQQEQPQVAQPASQPVNDLPF